MLRRFRFGWQTYVTQTNGVLAHYFYDTGKAKLTVSPQDLLGGCGNTQCCISVTVVMLQRGDTEEQKHTQIPNFLTRNLRCPGFNRFGWKHFDPE